MADTAITRITVIETRAITVVTTHARTTIHETARRDLASAFSIRVADVMECSSIIVIAFLIYLRGVREGVSVNAIAALWRRILGVTWRAVFFLIRAQTISDALAFHALFVGAEGRSLTWSGAQDVWNTCIVLALLAIAALHASAQRILAILTNTSFGTSAVNAAPFREEI